MPPEVEKKMFPLYLFEVSNRFTNLFPLFTDTGNFLNFFWVLRNWQNNSIASQKKKFSKKAIFQKIIIPLEKNSFLKLTNRNVTLCILNYMESMPISRISNSYIWSTKPQCPFIRCKSHRFLRHKSARHWYSAKGKLFWNEQFTFEKLFRLMKKLSGWNFT